MSVISGTVGAVMGSDATEEAAKTAAGAQENATQLQSRIYDNTQSEWAPYRASGEKANAAMDKMLYGGYDMQSSPSAQYALTSGTRSLNSQLAARGQLSGGSAANKLADLSSQVAASDYTTRYNQLLNAIQTGTGAVAGTGSAGTTLGNQAQSGASNLGNIATESGKTTASLYSGIGSASANTAATGLKAYQAYNSAPADKRADPTADTSADLSSADLTW